MSENMDAAIDKLNENECVQKIKANKNYKYIRIGAIVALAILMLAILSGIFGGDKYAKKAKSFLIDDTKTVLGYESCTNIKVNAKLVDKNKKEHLYVFEVETTYKQNGEKQEATSYDIISSDKDGSQSVGSYPYEKQTKKETKESACNQIHQ